MPGGELGERAGLEFGEFGDDGIAAGKALPELPDFLFEAGDLGVARVGDLACGSCPGEALPEVVFEVGVGAVEGGAGDPGDGRKGLDVTSAAGGRSPRRSWSAARMRVSACWRCWLVRGMSVSPRAGGGVDLLEPAGRGQARAMALQQLADAFGLETTGSTSAQLPRSGPTRPRRSASSRTSRCRARAGVTSPASTTEGRTVTMAATRCQRRPAG